jgi:putative sigma-54 modulation protein
VQVSISVRHGQLAESTQENLKSKVEKLSRFFYRLLGIEIVVDLQDEQSPVVEIMVSAEHKHDFVAKVKSGNLTSAADAASQKIEQQLRKYKEKLQQKHRNSQQRRPEVVAETETETETEEHEEVSE